MLFTIGGGSAEQNIAGARIHEKCRYCPVWLLLTGNAKTLFAFQTSRPLSLARIYEGEGAGKFEYEGSRVIEDVNEKAKYVSREFITRPHVMARLPVSAVYVEKCRLGCRRWVLSQRDIRITPGCVIAPVDKYVNILHP